jgi:hypothetical protein
VCDSATVAIAVNPSAPVSLEVRVATSTDDAEENASGRVSLTSSDLELVHDKDAQTVGVRFTGVALPQGATIVKAYIQFKADETNSDATTLTIQGEAAGHAIIFDNTTANISSRSRTVAAVSWAPAPWARGEAGLAQQTPDIASIVQEVVDRVDWSSGNALAVIITGSGKRVAESYNGDAPSAPLLHVEYNSGPPNDPPIANDDYADTVEDMAVTIDVTANDSDPEGELDLFSANIFCTSCAQPSNGSLANNGGGSFTYTPNRDYNGVDSFVYEICDTRGGCDTAMANITIEPVVDPPLADDDVVSTVENTAVTIDVAANDSDPDGDLDPTSADTDCTSCAGPAHGSLVNQGDGTFDYAPDPDYSGTDSFVYQICDVGGLCDTATVSITIHQTGLVTVDVRVAASSDDAEENASGRVSLTSSDLELVHDKDAQTVGMRFAGVALPQGATIAKAYVQFKADESDSEATTLTIQGEAVGHAAIFDNTAENISRRFKTMASVSWDPAPWARGEAGFAQQTPDIASIVQEVVDRADWSSGNALVVIITGSGKRVAESYNGDQAGAALLHIEYRLD